MYTIIHYKGTGHMGLCDLSVVSPILSAILSGGIPKVNAYDQLKLLNEDCLKWIWKTASRCVRMEKGL